VQCATKSAPDIVMLGQDLPGEDALDVCRQIRHSLEPGRPPVFLLTPENETDVVFDGRLAGGGREQRGWNFVEYGFGALLAWIDASGGVHERISCDGLELNRRRFQATVDGRDVKLTSTEFRLLWTLASEPGKVFDRRQLARCNGVNRSRIRTVDVHVKAIRDKLGDRAAIVETVHGVGYRLREPEPAGLVAGDSAG
jgi:two-component system phosphate regulon response regulator PhoB